MFSLLNTHTLIEHITSKFLLTHTHAHLNMHICVRIALYTNYMYVYLHILVHNPNKCAHTCTPRMHTHILMYRFSIGFI